MTKKSFKGGFEALLGNTSEESQHEINSIKKESKSKKNTINVTLVIDKDLYKKFKLLAFWKETTISNQFENAVSIYIERYEAEEGNLVDPLKQKTRY